MQVSEFNVVQRRTGTERKIRGWDRQTYRQTSRERDRERWKKRADRWTDRRIEGRIQREKKKGRGHRTQTGTEKDE